MSNISNTLSNARIINFLRHIKNDSDITAVEIANEHLDAGKSLEELFKKKKGGYGHFIRVDEMGPNTFKIEYGCQAGPLAGDGGDWTVGFDDNDNVVTCVAGSAWMS